MREQFSSVNGIDLYSLTNPNLKSFCLSLYIRSGSLFEDSSDNGISHLFEHIVFRNLKRKYRSFYELLAMHGIDLCGCTYKEFIRFTINGPYYEFNFAIEILYGLFDEIQMSSDEFSKEKKRIKAEIREENERSTLDYFLIASFGKTAKRKRRYWVIAG
ncbi:MAG: insulinase family protein [Oscillospiraceae bacterium]|nr:insulinase family protein [Oscillospiraceae bacterium]